MSAALPRQMATFIAVGLIVYAVDIAIFASWRLVAADALVGANVAAKAGGALTGFTLHRRFTFAAGGGNAARQGLAYLALLACNIAVATMLLWLAVDRLGLPVLPAKMLIDIGVIGLSFVGSRLLFSRL